MHSLLLLFLLAKPFWEAKAPQQWTDAEVELFLHSGPWSQTVGPEPEVRVWLAMAAPMEEAEREAVRRSKLAESEPDLDYTGYVKENGAAVFVLAVKYPTLKDLGNAAESRALEEQSLMKIGRKTYHIAGHFPPTPSDPVLRLVFPRAVRPTDKEIEFQLYLPGLPFPERSVIFTVKDLIYRGKLAM